jgi:small-conductance mechanosensitive channel
MDRIVSIIIRYIASLAAAAKSLWIFYFVFTPLTVYPVYFILNALYGASLVQSTIIINGTFITLIDACIAGSSYFLLTILNFFTPVISFKKRMLMLGFEFLSFLAVNILRIIILSALLLNGFPYFTTAHLIAWHLVSAVFVILIWIVAIKIFSVKEIPFYSDFAYIRNAAKSASSKE